MNSRYISLAIALATTVGCSKPASQVIPDPKSGTPTGVVAGTPTGTTDTGTTDTGTPEPTIDCTVLPPVPAAFTEMNNYGDAEDFDFDGNGYMVAVLGGTLVGKDKYGATQVLAGSMGNWTAGTRVLQTGDIAVARPGSGSLLLVDGISGGQTTILSGLSYPNGVEIDTLDNVYTADQDTGRLYRVNAYNPDDNEIIAEGLQLPNGVILSPDETKIYVGSFGGGIVYVIEKDPTTGVWGAPAILAESPGFDMGFDGINVDICGNVYFTEYIQGKVRRITPDGLQVDLVADLPSGWIPNMRWGHDIGGWSSEVLYVSDREQGRLFALDMGIPGKRHILMP